MKAHAGSLHGGTLARAPGARADLRLVAITAIAIVWLLGWYQDTVRALVIIWYGNQTFAHGFLIVPIALWLIWQRREVLKHVTVRPNLRAVPALLVAGLAWLLGEVTGVAAVEQYALVLMIPLIVWAILGTDMVRALAFPLAFLLLAVPVGEFLLPAMMEYTADFTVLALRLTGIPVYREGLFFTIPSGNWSVVEACSGLRYLIACATGGLLYAYLRYRSLKRRVIFTLIAIAVPIFANGVRAYMIVMIDHVSGRQSAIDVDHLLYGWVFFGIVTLILFWIGSFWREDGPEPRMDPHRAATGGVTAATPGAIAVAIAACAAVVAAPVAASRFHGEAYVAPVLSAPAGAGEWHREGVRHVASWTPHFLNSRMQIDETYAGAGGAVGLYVGYYRDQRNQGEMVTAQNVLVTTEDTHWRNVGESACTAPGREARCIEAQLTGPTGRLLVWRWYWVDGRYTASAHWAKVLQAWSTLRGRGDDAAVVIAYTEIGRDPGMARALLERFATAMLPGITEALNDAR